MKFNFNNYKGKFVMHCKTEEEAIEFCEAMHEAGRKWSNGEFYLDKNYWHRCKNQIYYKFNYGVWGNSACEDFTILEWSDFNTSKSEFDPIRECRLIHIGDITISIPINAPIGIARKHPDDKFNKEIGESVAYFRMKGVGNNEYASTIKHL